MKNKKFYKIDGKLKKELIYTGIDNSESIISPEVIMKSFCNEFFKFNIEEFTGDEVKNDEKLFCTNTFDGTKEVWQICSKVHDINQTLIPGCYYIRKIGYWHEIINRNIKN